MLDVGSEKLVELLVKGKVVVVDVIMLVLTVVLAMLLDVDVIGGFVEIEVVLVGNAVVGRGCGEI